MSCKSCESLLSYPPVRICYIHPAQVPSSAPSTVQVMRMCEGFTQVGCRPVLIVRGARDRQANRDERVSLFDYYGIRDCFDVHLMATPHLRKWGIGMGVVSSALFAWCAVRKAMAIQPDILYTRDIYTASLAVERGLKVVFEEHAMPRRRIHEWMRRRLFQSRNILGIVFISHALEARYGASGLLKDIHARTMVSHDAAAMSQVHPVRIPSDAPNRRPVIGYVGSFLPGRGIELIVSVADQLPQARFKLIGGTAEQMPGISPERVPANVECCGFVRPSRMPSLLDDVDILLMPYQNDTMTHAGVVSTNWMSPLKMFEYMASGIPVIASDLPVLREVLVHEQNSLLVSSSNVDVWAQAIRRLSGDPCLRCRLATNARTDVIERHNWAARAKGILDYLGSCIAI